MLGRLGGDEFSILWNLDEAAALERTVDGRLVNIGDSACRSAFRRA